MSEKEEISYIDRSTGKLIREQIPGAGMLKFFYQTALGRLPLYALLRRKGISALAGRFMGSKRSKKHIRGFVEKHGMDLSDYQKKEEEFQTFNDFFYRKLKDGARPIGDGLVSPADGKTIVFDKIDDQKHFFVKGIDFTLKSFLVDDALVEKYNGGAMVIVRLAPVDYHRFHFPASGIIGANKEINGHYYSVSPLALQQSLQIFCENKREYSLLATEEFGDVLICEVGATMVGSILQTYQENTKIAKGDEKGYFAFGGSTVVLLFEKNKVAFSEDLLKHTKEGMETQLKMGEQIGEAR